MNIIAGAVRLLFLGVIAKILSVVMLERKMAGVMGGGRVKLIKLENGAIGLREDEKVKGKGFVILFF